MSLDDTPVTALSFLIFQPIIVMKRLPEGRMLTRDPYNIDEEMSVADKHQ